MSILKEPITAIETARITLPTGLTQNPDRVEEMLKEVAEVMARHLGSQETPRIQGMHPDYRTGAKTYVFYFNVKPTV